MAGFKTLTVAAVWMLIAAVVWNRMQVEEMMSDGSEEEVTTESGRMQVEKMMSDSEEDVTTEDDIQFFLQCIRAMGLFDLRDEEFWSHPNSWLAIICKDVFRGVQYSYESSGRLPPGYADAVKAWFKGNQTLADFDICRLDHRRCPQRIADVLWELEHEDDPHVPSGFHDPRFSHVFY